MIFATIKSFFDAVAKIFSFAKVSKEKQCETEILKNKKYQEKKNDKQEDLLIDMANLLEKYQSQMTKSDRRRLRILKKRIKEVN